MSELWVRVCPESELAEGEIRSFDIEGDTILLARYGDKIFALEDTCSHDGAELSNGDLINSQIQCSRHGGRFDLETGEATQMPAIVGIKSYYVEIKDGDIYVALKK
ncbi:MAG: non-heme iron oxygenase ferredoxin subunit [Candidatus Zixiibacteriota bacterium]|nr:MAG: non-heme iron oxygenase ferredoxin subunit [candidate division Zixibacteria bacterium]